MVRDTAVGVDGGTAAGTIAPPAADAAGCTVCDDSVPPVDIARTVESPAVTRVAASVADAGASAVALQPTSTTSNTAPTAPEFSHATVYTTPWADTPDAADVTSTPDPANVNPLTAASISVAPSAATSRHSVVSAPRRSENPPCTSTVSASMRISCTSL